MVVMEKCKISDVSTLTEQNITDEEKSAAAAARSEGQKSRYTTNFFNINSITIELMTLQLACHAQFH